MSINVKVRRGWWMILLMSVATIACASQRDFRLAEAVRTGDKEEARSLLKQHVDVNASQPDGATALAWAIHRDDVETAEILVRAEANPNAAIAIGETALMTAANSRNTDAVKALLAHCADVNAKEPHWGQNALLWAVAEKHPEVVRLLELTVFADSHRNSTNIPPDSTSSP